VQQAGPAEAEHLRNLANVSSAAVRTRQQRINPEDELPEENKESDPLLSSHRKMQ
jgi:hypothetical protein